ncbi:MAG: NAD(P)/FAD-dependent oxidoreductase [Microcella sp.]|uniref:phytoene desaturase family protein n=1 Tax=Microcella sp. TaxID=1913979 RepID=UPI0024C9A70A|nr:NAD(P)/FAD-dependent oxidoreductase [Microcella sp.]UYN83773.1 MAG: NAD(P)/FAD-dependent oxidoreductase [Microcella sp.]
MSSNTAVVVGSGPNGLAAAAVLARAGVRTTVLERADSIGGGARTAELTLPGFAHDLGSAVHPLAVSSGFFRRFELQKRIELVTPEVSYGHPLDDRPAVLAYRDLERTVEHLGVDGSAWRSLLGPLVERAQRVAQFAGSSLLRVPAHPVTTALFGLRALEQGSPAWNLRWREAAAPALLSGVAAHSVQPMPSLSTSGAALALATAGHAGGWPIPIGGSQSIIDALVADLRAHGGTIETGVDITSLAEVEHADAVLLDITPRALVRLASDSMPASYRRRLLAYRHGDAVAKVDFALSGPVPWIDPALRTVPTLHLGGTRERIAAAEAAVARGQHADDPYVLVSQPSTVDPSRAPDGKHVLWTYTHVPHGSTLDQTEAIIRQIERWAPGFRDVIEASTSATAMDMQRQNANYIGGDIATGAATLWQLAARPTLAITPWRTPMPGVYLCSSATPPGPGVHGLAGAYAARSALRHEFGIERLPFLGVTKGEH